MSNFNATHAALTLSARRLLGEKGERLEVEHRPLTLAQGFAVQSCVSDVWCTQKKDTVAGWKCLLPPEGKWVVAPIYATTVHAVTRERLESVPLWPKDDQARIEPELAFVFGTALPARGSPYTAHEIDAAIDSVHIALELIDCRYLEPDTCEFPELLADGLFNQGLVIGAELDRDWAYRAGTFQITVCCGNAEPVTYQGRHQNDDPVAPLYWLVNFLSEQGIGIERGQKMITGSYAGVISVPLDVPVEIRYDGRHCLRTQFTRHGKSSTV